MHASVGDFNTKFGWGQGHKLQPDEQVGWARAGGADTTISRALREWMQPHDLCLESSYFWDSVGRTFFSGAAQAGKPEAKSHIDHIMLPTVASNIVEDCYISARLMRKMQILLHFCSLDHCPVMLEIRAQLRHSLPAPRKRVDADLMMKAVVNKKPRAPFVEAL